MHISHIQLDSGAGDELVRNIRKAMTYAEFFDASVVLKFNGVHLLIDIQKSIEFHIKQYHQYLHMRKNP